MGTQRGGAPMAMRGKKLVCEEEPMSTYYAMISALMFAVVAVAHLIRLLNRWTVQAGPYSVPMSVSWIGLVIAALISAWGFTQLMKLNRNVTCPAVSRRARLIF
jgi:hypothetical protein